MRTSKGRPSNSEDGRPLQLMHVAANLRYQATPQVCHVHVQSIDHYGLAQASKSLTCFLLPRTFCSIAQIVYWTAASETVLLLQTNGYMQ